MALPTVPHPVTSPTSNGPLIERLFTWFQNFRRLVVRYERFSENVLGMLHLACCPILLRGL